MGVRRTTVWSGGPAGPVLVAVALVAAVLATVVGAAAPAAAKGPTRVTVTDPSGHATELPATTGDETHEAMMWLTEDMGLWEAIEPTGDPLPAEPPVAPGPRFRVEWVLLGPPDGHRGDYAEDTVVQSLYPQAPGGPLVHTAPGQESAGTTTVGGWFRASSRLPETLAALGWSTKLSTVDGAPAGEPGASTDAARSAEAVPGKAWHASWGVRALAAGGLLVAVAAIAGGLARRRRRHGVPRGAAAVAG